jgi:hypothetical protein
MFLFHKHPLDFYRLFIIFLKAAAGLACRQRQWIQLRSGTAQLVVGRLIVWFIPKLVIESVTSD